MDRMDALTGNRNPDNAVITYMNMEFPDNLPEAASARYADEGAGDLSSMINGVHEVNRNDAHVTGLGHSYGSLTLSESLQTGGEVDGAMFYGSPGIESSPFGGFETESLGVPEGQVYAMQTWDDEIEPVQDVRRYLGAPYRHEGIERVELNPEYLGESALHDGRELATGHSGYHDTQSAALTNMALLATDNSERLMPYDVETREELANEKRQDLRGAGLDPYSVDLVVDAHVR